MSKPNPHRPTITVPVKDNEMLAKVLDLVNNNPEITTLWWVININAIKRLGITDHGPIHFQIVANTGLQMLRLLEKRNIVPSIIKDFNLTQDHAEVIVVLACLLHDLGMSVNREFHEHYSLYLANDLLKQILDFLPVEDRTVMIAEIQHAIVNHRSGGRPLTLEAGIVRVADALDMTKGRSRIPYEAGKIDIHSVSAMAIDEIEIHSGKKVPIQISITMNHTAGIFQVDNLIKKEMIGSGLEEYIDFKVYMYEGGERKLFKDAMV